MLYIRAVKTSSGATAVQIVRYFKRKREIVSHIGSANSEEELSSLKRIAYDKIHRFDNQMSLFDLLEDRDSANISSNMCRDADFYFDKLEYVSSSNKLLYEVLSNLVNIFEFNKIDKSKIINDLAIARLVSPGSKVESLEFISDNFGITHSRATFYRQLSNSSVLGLWQDKVEQSVIKVAKQYFSFDFSLVFYDLTTLYFESFETDEIRRIGFSKDNKSSNPQIMIGLLVNKDGFPISYQIFPGNKFEGHTLIPSILSIKDKYEIKDMNIVADSAMLSDDNIEFIKNQGLNYIVAARTANLKFDMIHEVSSQLNQQDDATIRIKTKNKGVLICHFSKARYNKEKSEMEKQLQKANLYLNKPSQAEIIKRTKFLTNVAKNKHERKFELNNSLIIKTKLLLGIKGYFTNQESLNDQEIISQYKNLWNVEKSFRISKNDLKIRPIFHSKEQSIQTHILICFMALAIAKYIEIKTGKSIKSTIKSLQKVTDVTMYDPINKKEITKRAKISPETKKILKNLKM